ncbi:MAG: WbqC family protein [Bacteroidales bacterium]|nr:WbqC family protein [Candidatus Cacconaster merdequi]
MALFDQIVLTSAYLPPVEYFFAVAQSKVTLIEQCELYQKQSYRNRCVIYSAGGPESLSIPVVKDGIHSKPIRDIRIDYSEPWLQHHLRAFKAAYNSSPFYSYYEDDFLSVFNRKPEFLFDLNMELLLLCLNLLGLKAEIRLTEEYEKEYANGDFRVSIQPKYKGRSLLEEYEKEKTYFQVFSPKSGFVPNLSVIDILSNEGPNAISFLL